MRLTALLLTVAFIHTYAGGVAQKVTLTGQNLTLRQTFNAIEKQTGFSVFFIKKEMENTHPVTVSVTNMELTDFLDLLLKNQPLTYHITDKTIFLSRKKTPPAINENYTVVAEAPPQPEPISGIIKDSLGTPLSGATILNRNTQITTTSQPNGRFTIPVNAGDVLEISFVGYTAKTIRITASLLSGQSPVLIVLSAHASQLNEVEVSINTGYQSVPRERMTGSFSTIQTKRLDNKLQPSLLTALEGQASGVVVTKEGKVEIRGKSTFLANADPLIVVDGYPISGGLETINIDNIETVTVLKDAVAASIYGARSSNGVIVITTKTARKGTVQMRYKGSTGITLKPNLSYLNKTGSADYVDAEIEAYQYNPVQAQTIYDRYAIASRVTQLLIANDRGTITEADMNTELDQLRQNNGIGQLEQDLFRPRFTQQHNISLSGGSEQFATNAAVRYVGNNNNTIGNSDNRVILDLKSDWKPASIVTVGLLSNINFSGSDAPVRSASELYSYTPGYNGPMLRPYDLVVNPATGQRQDVPLVRPELIDQYNAIPGSKPMNYNPLDDLLLETTRNRDLQARLGATIDIKLPVGLGVRLGGSWTRGSALTRTLYDANAYRVRALYNGATSISDPTKHYIPDGSIIDESRNINEAYTLRGQLNFNRTFSNLHHISAIAGGEINKDVLDNNVYPTRYGYNDQAGSFSPFNYTDYNAGLYYNDFQLPSALTSANNGSYTFRDNRFVSMYANGSYEYDRRFIVSGSIRIDQANFFGTNPRYRYKPNWSVGGTYKLGQEKFFNVPWIDKLDLRGSYGINGNISLNQGPYLLLRVSSYSTTSGGIVYSIASPPNKDLRWERTMIGNFGTDMTLFHGRLNATIDYYNKLSKDLLAPDFVDPTHGRSSITRNAGTARNTGIELSLESDVLKTKQFTWNLFFKGSYNHSKVLQFNYDYLYTTYLTLISSASLFGGSGGAALKAGYPLDAVFSYQFAGLDNTGTATFYTADKTQTLGGNLAVNDMVYSGTIRPKYVLALTNTFSYDRFDLSFMFVSQLGGIFRKDVYNGYNYENKYVSQRWRVPGDEATTIYPKLTTSSSATWYYPYSDILVESADFIKLRDLTLSYRLNDRLWKQSGINNAKLYFQGRNLWMATANDDNIDPETMIVQSDGSMIRNLPLKPEFYIGLSLNF